MENTTSPALKPLWIPLEEAARLCSISTKTVRTWACAGRIKIACAQKQGGAWRFNREFIEKHGIQINPVSKRK